MILRLFGLGADMAMFPLSPFSHHSNTPSFGAFARHDACFGSRWLPTSDVAWCFTAPSTTRVGMLAYVHNAPMQYLSNLYIGR
jgi:hypothetical protein